MTLWKKLFADLLFGVQAVCAVAFGMFQAARMTVTLQGVSLSMFLTCIAFFVINFRLSLDAHRFKPSRVTSQVAFMYALWAIMMSLDVVALARHGGYAWSVTDSISIGLTSIGIAAALMVAKYRGLGQSDPMVRGWVAVFFKSVPQFLLAVKIGLEGPGGTPGSVVVAGLVSMVARSAQIYLSTREARNDRSRTASAISEIGNILSWTAVSVVWLLA